MKENYFKNHYSHINKIDIDSEDSVRQWVNISKKGYEREMGQYLQNVQNKKILELGCGIGGTLNYLLSIGATDILGVDHSEDQLAVCKKYVTQMVENSDVVTYLQNTANSYDYIIALDLIEHLPKNKIVEFNKMIYKSLKVGGEVIVRTPNMGSLTGLRSRYIDFTHETGFTEESIRQVLFDAGFKDINIHNNSIGKKRLFVLNLFQRLVEKLYAMPRAEIVTQNLIAIAKKGNE